MVVKTTRKQLKHFSEVTSSHGVPHIGSSKHKMMIAFWVLITLLASCLMVWQVTQLIIKYLQYPVSVGLQLRFEQRDFPAVTFCNMNPYLNSQLEKYPVEMKPVQEMLDTYIYALQQTSCDLEQREDYEQFISEFPECTKSNASAELMERYEFKDIYDTVALQVKARDLLVMLMAGVNLDDSLKTTLSIQKQEFLKSCSFNAQDCNINDFMEFFDPKLGNCFTFNKVEKPNHTNNATKFKARYESNRAGPLYGLRLILLTNTSEYLPLTEKAGVMVVIHNQTEQPFPDTFGYSVEVGTATSIGVSFKEMHRLGKPYGGCTSSTESGDHVYDGAYTSEGCQRSCLQQQVVSNCGCNDPNFPNKIGSDAPRCNGSNPINLKCWDDKVGNKQASLIESCDCPLACEEGVFDVTVSAAQWPTKKSIKIADCKEGKYGDKTCLDIYRNNGVLVNVFYEQLNFQRLEESPAYRFVNLASDFGGQIGLWLGLSFISVVEWIMLIVQMGMACCNFKNVMPL